MRATIKSISLENFKGVKSATYNFEGKNVSIMGANATGKTTIADSLWWLLFNKDSQGNEKFSIRPLDKDGKQIDNVEICVSAVLDIDGKEMELKKVQKQNWVKKRGTSETVLQGNVNSYDVDGYPKSEKEYKECVAGIVSEDLFKILTSPTYFPNMKWQEQREILMKFVTDISDVELARQDERFADLIGELEKAPSTDDIKKKYQKALSERKKKQAELPVRIDEAEKQKVDIDFAELESQKNALNEQIAENNAKQEDISKQFEEQQKASDGVIELQMELNSLQQKADESLDNKRREIRRELDDLDFQLKEVKHQIRLNKQDIQAAEDSVKSNEARIQTEYGKWNDYNNELKVVEKYEMDENSLICSMCGQEFPVKKKKELVSDFDEKKRKKIEQLKNDKSATEKRGSKLRTAIDKDKVEIKQLKSALKENEDEKINLAESIKGLEKTLEEVPQSVDISNRPEVQEIQKQIAEKEAAMKKGNSAEEIRQQLKDDLEDLQSQKTEVEKQLAFVQKNVEIDDRIAELQKEQREVAQKVADQEKMLYLLEEFIRFKMDSVSETINSQFEMVNFILFRNQINGGLSETCECEYGGVPYASLNSAAKIQCGLDIIRTLQKFHDVYCPVFVDNRESCTEIPKMDCQVISLYVEPSCEELKIEMEG